MNIDGYANNPENSSTTKPGERIPCGCSISTIRAFDYIENKQTCFILRGKLHEKVLYFFIETCHKCN